MVLAGPIRCRVVPSNCDGSYRQLQLGSRSEFRRAQDVQVSIEGAGAADPFLDKSIREAIEVQLARKGLTKSGDRARLLIAYQVSAGRENTIAMYSTEGSPWGYGLGWLRDQSFGYEHGYNYVGVPPLSTSTDARIPIGNLVLDMYDSAYRDLIWRGEVEKALNFVDDADKRWKQLNGAVAQLFKPYPPKPRKYCAGSCI